MNVMNYTDSNVFRAAQFSGDKGVYAVWMVVPNPGTTGSSPDFAAGPIIPNSLFPIHIYGVTYRNNQVGTPEWPPSTCRRSTISSVAPSSWMVTVTSPSSSRTPPSLWLDGVPTGHFEYRVKMTDTTGNGWFITIGFTVQQ